MFMSLLRLAYYVLRLLGFVFIKVALKATLDAICELVYVYFFCNIPLQVDLARMHDLDAGETSVKGPSSATRLCPAIALLPQERLSEIRHQRTRIR